MSAVYRSSTYALFLPAKTNWCVPKISLKIPKYRREKRLQSKWNVIRSWSKKKKTFLGTPFGKTGKWCRRCVMRVKSLSKCFAEKCCILNICKWNRKSLFARATIKSDASFYFYRYVLCWCNMRSLCERESICVCAHRTEEVCLHPTISHVCSMKIPVVLNDKLWFQWFAL